MLFFDARPNEKSKFYGSIKTNWPFQEPVTIISGLENFTPKFDIYNSLNIEIFELFADFSWNDKLFFRFGKHTVKWGVGYFWSPADTINIGAIDVENPNAQLEGPVNL